MPAQLLPGDELFSDANEYKEIQDGFFLEAEGKVRMRCTTAGCCCAAQQASKLRVTTEQHNIAWQHVGWLHGYGEPRRGCSDSRDS